MQCDKCFLKIPKCLVLQKYLDRAPYSEWGRGPRWRTGQLRWPVGNQEAWAESVWGWNQLSQREAESQGTTRHRDNVSEYLDRPEEGTLVGACEGRMERASSLESVACTWNPKQDWRDTWGSHRLQGVAEVTAHGIHGLQKSQHQGQTKGKKARATRYV